VEDVMEIIKKTPFSNLSDINYQENFESFHQEKHRNYERRNLRKSYLKRKLCEQIPEEFEEQKVFCEAIKEVYSDKEFLKGFKEAEAEIVLKGILENVKRKI